MPRKKKENYFTKDTELAIIKYNNSDDPDFRAKIFSEEIYYPFYKLAENIIHTFKFYYTDIDDIEDLKHKIITILLEEKISKFDPNHGAKAYSYFGTIVKRWLINYNNKNYKQLKKRGTFEEYEVESVLIEEPVDENTIGLPEFIDIFVKKTYNNFTEIFPKPNDQRIADAVLTVFSSRNDLEIFKKKALYIYIREMTDCNTPNLTSVINVLKQEFYKEYYEMLEEGTLRV